MKRSRQAYENVVKTYFEGCNAGDADTIAACLAPDATHYFPAGMYGGPWRSAQRIAEGWCSLVRDIGSMWTLDRVLVDAESDQAVAEWTHYKTSDGRVLRGDEWYVFDPESGLIKEIRAYYASPQASDLTRLELEGFDYAGRAYSTEPPFSRQPL